MSDMRHVYNAYSAIYNPEIKKNLEESRDAGFLALKGHRSVGGMRASIYNAMPEEGVDALVGFMEAFEKEQS